MVQDRTHNGTVKFLYAGRLINNKTALILNVGQASAENLRTLANSIVIALGEVILLLASEDAGKVALLARVTPKFITKELNTNIIVKKAAEIVGGGGGGKPDQAQAGGKDPARLPEALEKVQEYVQNKVK